METDNPAKLPSQQKKGSVIRFNLGEPPAFDQDQEPGTDGQSDAS
jgi:hypothetical protein